MENKNVIHVKGAAENNLKKIDLEIPRDKLVVITGISGSGKSSLAFDTLYAEGHRRFAESLSSFARQFLGRMSRPDVDYITGIPPAIAVKQGVSTANPRSTIGTKTEIYDYLRVLFAKIGRIYSPVSGVEVRCDSAKSVVEYIVGLKSSDGDDTVAFVAARIDWGKYERVEKIMLLKEAGFTRVISLEDGQIYRMDDILTRKVDCEYGSMALLVDRLIVSDDEDFMARALDSVDTALQEGGGYVYVGTADNMRSFSNILEADGMVFEKPVEDLFSYNSPLGACPSCGGYGKVIGIDEALVVPNPALSIYEGAVVCWRGETMKYFYDELVNNAYKFDFPIHKPYHDLTREQKNLLWDGNEYFTGINAFFDWVRKNRYKVQYNYMLSRYSGRTICRDCGGSRLKKEALYVLVGGKNISEVMDMPITDLVKYFDDLERILDPYEKGIVEKALKEIRLRLEYMMDVGLGYLTLSRSSSTLSGGESQRINLVSSLGKNLVGSLYILDEPSIGLHNRDTQRLISILKRLRDLGNTVIVVEHDPEIIAAADHLIDIGPYAGTRGGEVVYQGPPPVAENGIREEGLSASRSITLDYLTGVRRRYVPENRHMSNSFIEICGACENNLKNIDVRFPLRSIVAVTGVSGSGKSSLVGDILYPALFRHFNQVGNRPGAFKELRGDLNKLSAVEYVNQNPIGKSSRSNPVTYLKVYDDIRKLFSEQPYAKLNGYGHSHFSFNIDGGRCPECQGEGVIHIEMQFMADVTMVCESCGGKRFLPDILEVRYYDKNINDVLNMTVEEAMDFFGSKDDSSARRIAEKLQPLVDVGLSYLQLGQNSSTLSGGESQRIKLASFLGKEQDRGPILFIFDEPTNGLHFYDIEKLLKSFSALVAKGHSIIVIEHNLDVIRAADYVIELGPDAGDHGGELVFCGTPEQLASHPEFPTGKALSEY